MSALAGTISPSTHFCVKDRQTFTISVDEPAEGFMTLAYWDQSSQDDHRVLVVPRDQFDRAIEAYLGVYA